MADVEVWEENWRPVVLLGKMLTQWRVGMSSLVGLDYAALYPLLDRVAQSREEWDELFDDVRAMEHAILDSQK